jgi:hypothetical protein
VVWVGSSRGDVEAGACGGEAEGLVGWGEGERMITLVTFISFDTAQRFVFGVLDVCDASRARFLEDGWTYGGAGCGSGSGLLGGREVASVG